MAVNASLLLEPGRKLSLLHIPHEALHPVGEQPLCGRQARLPVGCLSEASAGTFLYTIVTTNVQALRKRVQ